MLRNIFLVLAATFSFAATPLPATAFTIDFTDETLFDVGDLSESFVIGGGSVTTSLSSNGTLNFTTFDGDASVAALAFDHDGVGVGDDEITTGGEQVTVSFSETVAVVGFHFLDLFVAQDQQDAEVAQVYNNGLLVGSFTADLLFQLQGGYKFAAVSPIFADTLVFMAAAGNDNVGYADYALAAIDVTPVPLPAALPLFAGGLGILSLLGWRRKRMAAA